MLFADLNSIDTFLAVIGRHQNIAYAILFFGSFFETLAPFSFVVYGELFFLSGAVLAGTGELDFPAVAIVLYAGGILGDNCSYWLGRRYGMGLFNVLARLPLSGKYLNRELWQRGLDFFQQRGGAAVFLARLCGPFSWFVPALAGAFGQRYSRFFCANALGVMVGIGEFLLVGYLFGTHLHTVVDWLNRTGYMCLALLPLFLAAALFWRRHTTGQRAKLAC